jgi:small GTP-binding protein
MNEDETKDEKENESENVNQQENDLKNETQKENEDDSQNVTEKEDDGITIEEIQSNFEKEYYKLKLIVLGDSGVGKTNIIQRYVSDQFSSETKATVGVEFFTKTFRVNDDILKLEIWDTAGQERYKAITSAYYRGSRGALLVYDITRIETFNNIERWMNDVKEKVEGTLKLLIIGNKSDLNEERKMSIEAALNKARQFNVPLMETSALNSNNIKRAFETLLKEMYKEFKKEKEILKKENKNKTEGLNLDVETPQKKGCC